MDTPKIFIIFQEGETQKTLSYIRKRNFSYISGNKYSKPWHNGTVLYFWKWSFPGLIFLLYASK